VCFPVSASGPALPRHKDRTQRKCSKIFAISHAAGKIVACAPPPWHYSSDCFTIEYRADPQAGAAALPPSVTADERSSGRAFFRFLDLQLTGSNDEVTDPARYRYREAFAMIEAIFDADPDNCCPHIFVDNDAAIAGVWAQGLPKKYANV
jgi:Acetoacetate decarboxylase (ADC)